MARFLLHYRTTPHTLTLRSPAELFLGRQPRTHLSAVSPDLSQHIRDRQSEQKEYRDRGASERDLSIGDKVYVSAVDRLRGVERCRWVPGVVLGVNGVKFTIELADGRIVVRHADVVRRRYSEHTVPTSSNVVFPSSPVEPVMPPVPRPLLVPVSAAPVPGVPATGAPPDPAPVSAAAPVPSSGQSPWQQPVTDSRSSGPGESSPALPVVPSAGTPVGSTGHGYNLRNRATLRAPDRY